jgi:sulfatase modifying factor 1
MLALAPEVHADIDPLSGIDLIRITAVGNAPYTSNIPNDFTSGRGGVGYEYRIGRMEVTTSQWVEFFNAAYDRPREDWIPFVDFTTHWGAVPTTPNTAGGARWTVGPGGALLPVGNISWRTAAIYCNWLHNGKSTAREAFMSGAYDVSTFGDLVNEAPTHMVGARYWIPTFDEQLKAFHYDPNKPNPDGTLGGWWSYSNGSDTPYVYGPPGVLVNGQPTQANAGWDNRDYPLSPFSIPLGSYPDVQTPWGLLDASGGTGEWTETKYLQTSRISDGSFWTLSPGQANLLDRLSVYGGDFPHIPTLEHGLRIASVPSPGTIAVGLGVCIALGASRRRGWMGK